MNVRRTPPRMGPSASIEVGVRKDYLVKADDPARRRPVKVWSETWFIDLAEIGSTRKISRPTGAAKLDLRQNRQEPTTANPRLHHRTSPVAPQRPRTVSAGRPPSRRHAKTLPNAGLTPVDGTATVYGRIRPSATSTEVGAAKPGRRHWPPLVAPWRLSTPLSGGHQARGSAQSRPDLHQPRLQPGHP